MNTLNEIPNVEHGFKLLMFTNRNNASICNIIQRKVNKQTFCVRTEDRKSLKT